jgi:hypothetical protein
MQKAEPPSSNGAKDLYLVGKDSQGHWVVLDQDGLRGGLFVNRAEALKYAMFENGHRPQAVIMVPGTLELNLDARRKPTTTPIPTPAPLQRVA